MTKQEFEDYYIKNSGITKEYYHENFKTLPCNCEDYTWCEGWAAVRNDDPVKRHANLYV